MPGRGCTDQMRNLRHTLEQRWSFQQATAMCFFDFGMPPKDLRLIKTYYASYKMKVSSNGGDSMYFEIRSGVRQGYTFSPTLVNRIIDWILGRAFQDYSGVQVGANVHVSDLVYAGDISILSSSNNEMEGLPEADYRQVPQ